MNVLGVEVVEQLGSLLLGGLVKYSLHVGHEDGKICAHINSDGRGEAVVVSDVQGATGVSVILNSV